MSRVQEFRLPDLGEGLTEGEILQWLVQVGDTVTLNQPIVEVETAKAAVEVPSPFAGVVLTLHAEAGQTIDVGAPLITFDTEPGAGDLPEAPAVTDQSEAAGAARQATAEAFGPEHGALIGEVGPGGRTATLVGYGPKAGSATRRPRVDVRKPAAAEAPPAPAPAPSPAAPPVPPPATAARVSAAAVGQAAAAAAAAGGVTVLAKPPVRKLARELGVDLTTVRGTGARGVITRDDVEAAAESGVPVPRRDYLQPVPGQEGPGWFGVPPYDPQTREYRIPVKGVRKAMAQAMAESAFTAPHVTEFLTVDMTPTMELVARLKQAPELAGVKVSPLLLVAKALLLAVKRHPEVNSTFTGDEIVVKDYVHLGIAAATPRGLLVPNIKDADKLSLAQLAQALQELAETARAGKTQPADMQGGTITITNVGVFGVDIGTPIINPGESAILAFGAVRPMPWVVDGSVQVRQVGQLALSFDHRHIDGKLGSEFLADLGRVLGDPAVALLWA